MEFKTSDRLKLRVDALTYRLQEISKEVTQTRRRAYELQLRLEEITVSALLKGESYPQEELQSLRRELEECNARADAGASEEQRLREILQEARRDYLRQLRQERRSRWIVFE